MWEELNNENFNLTEYREIKINEIGTSSYTMSPKQWIQRTRAIGLIAKGGKYSIGTYAHPDLAFEFASWLNVEFKLYLIREFERLKQNENYQNKILQLIILSNLENLNSQMIDEGIKQKIRLEKLNKIAKKQYNILQNSNSVKKLEDLDSKNNIKQYNNKRQLK